MYFSMLRIIVLLGFCLPMISFSSIVPFLHNSGIVRTSLRNICFPDRVWILRSRIDLYGVNKEIQDVLAQINLWQFHYAGIEGTMPVRTPALKALTADDGGRGAVLIKELLTRLANRFLGMYLLLQNATETYMTRVPNLMLSQLQQQAPTEVVDAVMMKHGLFYNETSLAANQVTMEVDAHYMTLIPVQNHFRKGTWPKIVNSLVSDTGVFPTIATGADLKTKWQHYLDGVQVSHVKLNQFDATTNQLLENKLPLDLFPSKRLREAVTNIRKYFAERNTPLIGDLLADVKLLHTIPTTYLIREPCSEKDKCQLGVYTVYPVIPKSHKYTLEEIYSYPVETTNIFGQKSWKKASIPFTKILTQGDNHHLIENMGNLKCIGLYFGECDVCYIQDLDFSKTDDCVKSVLKGSDPHDFCNYEGVEKPQSEVIQVNSETMVVVSPEHGTIKFECPANKEVTSTRLPSSSILKLDSACLYTIEDQVSSIPKPSHNLVRFKEIDGIPPDNILSWREYLKENGVTFLVLGVGFLTFSVVLIYLWKIPMVKSLFGRLPRIRIFSRASPPGPTFRPLRSGEIRQVEFRPNNGIALL